MNYVYLLTGGNIGDRILNLQKAKRQIETQVGTVLKQSTLYETAAWGVTDQNAFLNQVLLVATSIAPEELLSTLLNIEQQLGRKRIEKMGPRTIDIDILFYNSDIISSPSLTVPHAQVANRRFV